MGDILLYHTGLSLIRRPELGRGRKNADFGPGFYTSPDAAFARRWAAPGDAEVFVNTYVLRTDGLDIRTLERDGAWFDTILSNRRGRGDPLLGCDAAAGPIANDTLFDTMGILTSGLIGPEKALRLLRIGPEYRQVVIKSERALSHLEWTGALTLTKEELSLTRERLRQEEREYLSLFTRALSSEEEA